MSTYSVRQAAKLIGIDPQTLFRWIWGGRVRPSVVVPMDGRNLYRFTADDVERLHEYKSSHYWKGRGGRSKKGEKQ